MNKKKAILMVAIVLSALLLLGILAVGVITYLAEMFRNDPLPEGFQSKHYSYEQVLDYAKSFDPNATVTDSYEEVDKSFASYREWPAVINGVECHVVSYPLQFQAKQGSSFMQTGYRLQTDYDYIILCEILKDHVELGTAAESRKYGSAISMEGTGPLPLLVKKDLDSIDEETFDDIWASYSEVTQEMGSRGATRELQLTIHLPDNVDIYILAADDESYQKAKTELFG